MTLKRNFAMAISIIFFSCGCTHYMPAAVSSVSLDSKFQVPTRVVTGRASHSSFLFFGPFGDASLLAAYDDARTKGDGDTLVNVTVDRKLFCFPACWLQVYMEVETIVHGTLVRYIDSDGNRLWAEHKATDGGKMVQGEPKMGPNELHSFIQTTSPRQMIELVTFDGIIYLGRFESYEAKHRTVTLRLDGSTSSNIISLYTVQRARRVE